MRKRVHPLTLRPRSIKIVSLYYPPRIDKDIWCLIVSLMVEILLRYLVISRPLGTVQSDNMKRRARIMLTTAWIISTILASCQALMFRLENIESSRDVFCPQTTKLFCLTSWRDVGRSEHGGDIHILKQNP